MQQLVTGSKILLALAGMSTAAAAIAAVATSALSRAEQTTAAATATRGEPGPERDREAPSRAGHPAIGSSPQAAPQPRINWRRSQALGQPNAGRLVDGVKLPAEGRAYFTWDPIHKRQPNRGWRRWGTDELVRTVLRVARDFARENPGAPRVAIGDLSRPKGGDFGPQFGSIGHASHQNGLDVDIYYPLKSGRERAPRSVDEVDIRLAQDLVDRFVRAGAEYVFVGPGTPLTGPPGVVQKLAHHDNHLHLRIRDR